MKNGFLPTWVYANLTPKGCEEVGFVAGPLMEWCHTCGAAHEHPAGKNCPQPEPQPDQSK